MGQRHRYDRAGELYHVMNRGIAKRTIAENRRDAERFFQFLTEAVEAGLITIEAAVLMTTHFHLLLRSVVGEFWRALRRFQNAHSRAFNRARRRDGPLFRGRYLSRHVASEAYWYNVIRYIDHNPVAARMVTRPEDHPFGSAVAFTTGARPDWLDRGPVEAYVRGWSGAEAFHARDYSAVFGTPPPAGDLIERRLAFGTSGVDTLDRLLPREPGRTLDWMTWKAELADGTSPGEPICTARTIDAVVAARVVIEPEARVHLRRSKAPAWPLVRIGLLRVAAGLGLREIASRTGGSLSTIHGRIRTHLELVRTDAAYAERATGVLDQALATDWPNPPEMRSPLDDLSPKARTR